ncbi:hypothetical protein B0A55_06787 [Friedmanniomyces simplex]|uniref:Uncharacterized protein n=1 Tax=Friedmanniomyces simplex TaxID=329884 RepID=A0A4U0XB54_9PEZI|nr:hypothetical protein B0A55_06787 [Friedmanniomyces simplex]
MAASLEHRRHLEAIGKIWGGQVGKIIRTHIRPLQTKAGITKLVDPMDRHRKMVQTLRKVATAVLPEAARHVREWWISHSDVLCFYEGLKKQGKKPRTLAGIERDGPAADWPDAAGKQIAYSPAGAYKPGYFHLEARIERAASSKMGPPRSSSLRYYDMEDALSGVDMVG